MDLSGPWADVDAVPLAAYPSGGPPAARLNEARAALAVQQWGRRREALTAAEADPSLVDQVAAERAIDLATDNRLDAAEAMARSLLDASTDPVARSRALEARGRALLWRGSDRAAREGIATMTDAIDAYRTSGSRDWTGAAQSWLANAGYLQRGDLPRAEQLFRSALDSLAPDSPRRTTVMTFLCDLLILDGRLDEASQLLDDAEQLVATAGDYQQAYIAWSRARLASVSGDRVGTVRAVLEVERHRGDWFDITSGATFLGDAAAMLERVGQHDLALAYLRRAADRDPDDEFVLMAEAELLARSGDPHEALRSLASIAQAQWLEIVQVWRMSLLSAWASVRVSRLTDATRAAVAGFAQAEAVGGTRTAPTNEPQLTDALAPIAARAGSGPAARLLSATGHVLLLLGDSALLHDSQPVEVPTGLPGALLRLVALHERGIDSERAIDSLWPDADSASGRKQLRTTLSRLNTRVDNLVVRDGSRLTLNGVWVDLRAFAVRADQALVERDADQVVAALAMWGGEPLPLDSHDDWAAATRDHLTRRRLRLLDLAAELVPARAEVYLEQAIDADPDGTDRYEQLAALLEQRGRPAAANRWRARLARVASDG